MTDLQQCEREVNLIEFDRVNAIDELQIAVTWRMICRRLEREEPEIPMGCKNAKEEESGLGGLTMSIT